MNGRMYDPVVGRFLGVDTIIQDANNSQSFNGYSCMNNPLKYIDPSGYNQYNPYAAYIDAVLQGYGGKYQEFSSQYSGQYYSHDNFNYITGEGGSGSMNYSWHTWNDSHEIVNGEIHNMKILFLTAI